MTAHLPSPELLSLIVDEAPQAMLVFSPDGRVLSWGRAAEALFGWTADEAIGQTMEQLSGAKEGGPDLRHLHDEVGRAGSARRVLLRRHKGGRLMHVETAWRAVHGPDGATSCYVASHRDVTGEQIERDIALVGERYRDLLDSVPDAIVIVNDVGAIVLFNHEASRLFGVDAESMVCQPVERLIPERFAQGHGRHREGFGRAPQRRPMGSGLELRGLRGDGAEFPVEVSLSPLQIGERRFVMATLRDLTERQRLEEAQLAALAAQRASSAKTEFLSRMSHELRTPLNAVLGFAQLLAIDPRAPLAQSQQRQVDHILRAGRHLLAMINDLLDVARIESGSLALSLEPVPLAALLDDVLALSQPAAQQASVNVALAIDSPTLHVQADRVRLRQVLLNLVSNAIKYNRLQGRVDVRVVLAGPEIEIAVADTGVGLTPAQLERLYRPFDRLGAEGGSVEGSGIGLVIARGLVLSMGGRIAVTSEAGVGSVFSIALPAAQAPQAPLAATEGLPPVLSATGPAALRRRVVYVEDNEVNMALVQAAFALRPQWTLSVARQGADAIELARREAPDLLVVDMHLPDMNGLELARRLDADPATAGIDRVALSADATEARARAAFDHGFERYFTKPLDIRDFLEWLDAHFLATDRAAEGAARQQRA